jgi:hypothetical protein
MHTRDSQFVPSRSLWRRSWRDLLLLLRIAKMTTRYVIVGARVRREYRRKQTSGGVYWLDDNPTLKG